MVKFENGHSQKMEMLLMEFQSAIKSNYPLYENGLKSLKVLSHHAYIPTATSSRPIHATDTDVSLGAFCLNWPAEPKYLSYF